ncbi:hypothetical protein NC651_011520 [Populus alba x Populus x berolinensis]|nr:hypothetical protein NC651_011520 [Populus alba x Populus x berolinensis]
MWDLNSETDDPLNLHYMALPRRTLAEIPSGGGPTTIVSQTATDAPCRNSPGGFTAPTIKIFSALQLWLFFSQHR